MRIVNIIKFAMHILTIFGLGSMRMPLEHVLGCWA